MEVTWCTGGVPDEREQEGCVPVAGVRATTMAMCRDTGFDGGLLVTSAVEKYSDGENRVGRDRHGGGGGRGISTLYQRSRVPSGLRILGVTLF